MKKKLLSISLIVFLNTCFASKVSLIDIPTTRVSSMADDISVVENNTSSVITNSALLCNIQGLYAFGYERVFYYANTTYDNISIMANGYHKLSVGLAFVRFDSGEMKIRNVDGLLIDETAKYIYDIFCIGLGIKILETKNNVIQIGFTPMIFLEKLKSDLVFFGSNISFIYDIRFNNKTFNMIRFGNTFRAITLDKNFITNSGIAIKLSESYLTLGFESLSYKINTVEYKISVSLNIFKSKDLSRHLYINLGYQTNPNYDNSISSGIDMKVYNVILLYSFKNHRYLQSLHTVGLSVIY
ncbi:MAG: hypothetical protein N2643_02290 [Endomicrobia bacterium]|nr:hypothetical protein [Endomicrobiia bacterium]